MENKKIMNAAVVNQTNVIILRLNERNKFLEKEIQLKENGIKNFPIQIDAMQKLHEEEMRKGASEHQAIKTKLEKCTSFLKNIKEKYNSLKIENENIETERQIQELKLKEKAASMEDIYLKTKPNSDQESIKKLRSLSKQLGDKYTKLLSENKENKDIIESQNSFIKELNKKFEHLEQESIQLKEFAKFNKNSQSYLNEKCSLLEEKLKAKEQITYDSYKEQVSIENRQLKAEVDIMKNKVRSLEVNIKKKNWRIDALNDQVTNNGTKVDKTEHEKITKKNKALADELLNTKTLLSSLKSELESVKEELSSLVDKLKSKDAYTECLDIKIDALYKRQIEKEAEEDKCVQRIDNELENLRKKYENENRELKEELKTLKKRKGSNHKNELRTKTIKTERKK